MFCVSVNFCGAVVVSRPRMHLDTISNREIYCELIELQKAGCELAYFFEIDFSPHTGDSEPLPAEVSTA